MEYRFEWITEFYWVFGRASVSNWTRKDDIVVETQSSQSRFSVSSFLNEFFSIFFPEFRSVWPGPGGGKSLSLSKWLVELICIIDAVIVYRSNEPPPPPLLPPAGQLRPQICKWEGGSGGWGWGWREEFVFYGLRGFHWFSTPPSPVGDEKEEEEEEEEEEGEEDDDESSEEEGNRKNSERICFFFSSSSSSSSFLSGKTVEEKAIVKIPVKNKKKKNEKSFKLRWSMKPQLFYLFFWFFLFLWGTLGGVGREGGG